MTMASAPTKYPIKSSIFFYFPLAFSAAFMASSSASTDSAAFRFRNFLFRALRPGHSKRVSAALGEIRSSFEHFKFGERIFGSVAVE